MEATEPTPFAWIWAEILSGLLLPFVLSKITSPAWGTRSKYALALGASLVVGIVSTTIKNLAGLSLSAEWIFAHAGAAMLSSHSFYSLHLKPRILRKENAVKTAAVVPILLVVALFVPGCQTTDPAEAVPVLESAAEGPRSGSATSGNESVEIPTAPAVVVTSPNSEAKATSVNSNYRPTASNAVSGHLVTGFVASISAQALAEIRKDPVLVSIGEELHALVARAAASLDDPESTFDLEVARARIDELRATYSTHRNALLESGRGEPPDLASLSHLVVVGIIGGNAGATERAPTDAEAANMPRLLTNIIAAARGEATLTGPGENVEETEEQAWFSPDFVEIDAPATTWPSVALSWSGTWYVKPDEAGASNTHKIVFGAGTGHFRVYEPPTSIEHVLFASNATHPNYLYGLVTPQPGPNEWKFVFDPDTETWKAYRFEGVPPNETWVYKGKLVR
jgi:hypothetical protein